MREQKRPTVRLVRNRDGSLRAVNEDQRVDSLKDMWGTQKAKIEITPTSLKQDFKELFTKKPKVIDTQKSKLKPEPSFAQTKPRLNSSSQQKVYTINLTVPRFNGLPEKLNKVPKKYALLTGAGLIIIIGAVVLWPSGGYKAKENASQTKVAGQIEYKVTPDFAVMSPGGGGVDKQGGYALISPKNAPKVYAYVDTINGIPIRVSQQELPDSIGQDAQKIAELASQFNANEEIEVDDRKAFVGTSLDGPQSVIFARENVMVLVVSDNQISNKDWVKYLGELRF